METAAETLVSEFASFQNWEGKYRLLIEKGRQLGPYPEEFRQDIFKVKGCQSQVWLYPKKQGENVVFCGDSDASIVKGIIAILLFVYNNQSPKNILTFKADFIEDIGLRQHLSLSRANGLGNMLKQMKLYAFAFSDS